MSLDATSVEPEQLANFEQDVVAALLLRAPWGGILQWDAPLRDLRRADDDHDDDARRATFDVLLRRVRDETAVPAEQAAMVR